MDTCGFKMCLHIEARQVDTAVLMLPTLCTRSVFRDYRMSYVQFGTQKFQRSPSCAEARKWIYRRLEHSPAEQTVVRTLHAGIMSFHDLLQRSSDLRVNPILPHAQH
jgi:hypothetical protein